MVFLLASFWFFILIWAWEQTCTADLVFTKDVLYYLSHSGILYGCGRTCRVARRHSLASLRSARNSGNRYFATPYLNKFLDTKMVFRDLCGCGRTCTCEDQRSRVLQTRALAAPPHTLQFSNYRSIVLIFQWFLSVSFSILRFFYGFPKVRL